MRIRTVTFDRLTNEEIAAWSVIQRAHPDFSSPYFRPEFTQHVAAVRPDVEVAVLAEAGAPVGFFPFQRSYLNSGQPIGSGVCDFQGLIASPELDCDPRELLRACGLSSWRFDHLVPVHRAFQRHAWLSEDSPFIDLPDGLESYLHSRENGQSIMSEYRRKLRRLEREVGPICFQPHVTDPAVLATCIRWKVEQYRRTGIPNIFKYAWVTKLLGRILACDDQDFAAAMPVLYAGDQIAAINFGMRSGSVFHSWFPAYNPEFANCSPGYLHFIELMKSAESLGVTRIVLGKGEEPYKRRLMSGVDRLGLGCVDLRPATAATRRAWRQLRETIKASPLRAPARVPARMVHRITHWLAFR